MYKNDTLFSYYMYLCQTQTGNTKRKEQIRNWFSSSRCSDRASEIYVLKCATGKGSVSAESLLLLFFLSESILHVRDFSK